MPSDKHRAYARAMREHMPASNATYGRTDETDLRRALLTPRRTPPVTYRAGAHTDFSTVEPETKTCLRCQESKDATQFGRHPRGPDGLQANCRGVQTKSAPPKPARRERLASDTRHLDGVRKRIDGRTDR